MDMETKVVVQHPKHRAAPIVRMRHPDFTSLAESLNLSYIQVLTVPCRVKLQFYLVPRSQTRSH